VGNYSFDKSRPAGQAIETKVVDPDHSRKKLAKDAADLKEKSERRAAYRCSLDAKWGAEAALLTDKQIAEIDQKFPEQGLYGRYLAAGKPRATDTQRKTYAVTLHECLEMESGGKSFEQMESGR
jgi:hypothetical protein